MRRLLSFASAARVAVVCSALLGPAPAAAADEVWVETAPLASRQEAHELLAEADLSDEGLTARVTRRFVKGSGWRFVVRIDGVDDVAEGRRLAMTLAEAGARALVLEQEGDTVRTAHDLGGSGAAATAGADPTATIDARVRLPDARAVLRKAVKAHGGARGGLELVEPAEALSLAYERTVAVDDGQLLAANRYFRQGEALRLEVEILEGVGTDSVTLVTPGNRAWVVVEDRAVARDVARTREVIARFGPESVLAVPLGLAQDVDQAADWQDVRVVGTELVAGREQLRVEPAVTDPARAGLVAAWFEADAGTLTQVQWRSVSGLLTFAYDDYREVDSGVIVPFVAGIERDGRPVERVRLLQFELDPLLDSGLFADP